MSRRPLLLTLLLLSFIRHANPDGGAVVFSAHSESLIFTAFITPWPVHAGQADLSVLLQRESDHAPVLNAQMFACLSKAGTYSITVPLRHTAATDKLLYAASLDIPEAGTYDIEVQTRTAKVRGHLLVLAEETPLVTYWPYFAVLPTVIGLFFLNRYLHVHRQRTSVRGR